MINKALKNEQKKDNSLQGFLLRAVTFVYPSNK